jgi:hypothetical protein
MSADQDQHFADRDHDVAYGHGPEWHVTPIAVIASALV